MRHLVIISGHSGSGKDYLAAKYWGHFTPLKLNQCFKDRFEQDHGLFPGVCNNRAYREGILDQGPCAGLTIQQAMVRCYTESLSPLEKTYGASFAGLTLLSALETITKTPGQYVITDLRKPSEALVLKEFATKQLGYKLTVYKIETNRGQVLESDIHQEEVLDILGDYSILLNYA